MLLKQISGSWSWRTSCRNTLLVTAVFLSSAALGADEVKNVTEFNGCRSLADDARRLLCYDTVADGGVFNEEKIQEAVEESFGTNESENNIDTDELSVRVIRVREGAGNVHFFYTENGAVWRQTNGRRWKIKAPFNATISSGVFSSYFLVTDTGKSTRVKRVK